MHKYLKVIAAVVCTLSVGHSNAQAEPEINVGVILSLTGQAASLGIPERDSILLWDEPIANRKVNFTIIDDGSDPTAASVAARKLITEKKVDVLIGPSVTPAALSTLQVAHETQTPMIAIAGGGAIVTPLDDARRWAFKLPPEESIPLRMIYDTMRSKGQKRLGIVAMNNAYGQTFVDVAQKTAGDAGIEIVDVQRFGGTDTSFVSQSIKLLSTRPDAVLIAAAGTPAAMPHLELKRRGFAGTIFQTQAVANNDFLRIGGKEIAGTYMPVAPFLVAEQLPDSHPTKEIGLKYVQTYEAKYGPNSRSLFGGSAWDTLLLLQDAAARTVEKAEPGTQEFKNLLRDEIENTKELVMTQGVYNMSPTDHNGADERSHVMVTLTDGQWRYVEP